MTRKKINFILSVLRYLPWSLYFNFRYLPLEQAKFLPILLYKPKLLKCKGTVKIVSTTVSTGMIRLGFYGVSLYPNNGITWENNGGKVVFEGSCKIGNSSFISIGENGNVSFGSNFRSSAGLKLVSYHQILFKTDVRIGWENTIMDTDFHKVTKLDGGYTTSFAPIIIGKNNWLGAFCLTLKGTETPDYCIFGARSVLSKPYRFEPYSLAAGVPAKLRSTGIYRNLDDDTIEYTL